jgi:hypothetical protein
MLEGIQDSFQASALFNFQLVGNISDREYPQRPAAMLLNTRIVSVVKDRVADDSLGR